MNASKPVEVVDDTHHGGWITIVAAIGMILLVFCLLLRVYLRITRRAISGLPDYVLLPAGVCRRHLDLYLLNYDSTDAQ